MNSLTRSQKQHQNGKSTATTVGNGTGTTHTTATTRSRNGEAAKMATTAREVNALAGKDKASSNLKNGEARATMAKGMDADANTTTETSLTMTTDLQTLNGLDKHRLGPGAFCCCGTVQLRLTAIVIAILELVIYSYQLLTSFVDLVILRPMATNDPTIPSELQKTHLAAELLNFLSLLLAVTAVVLLLIGSLRRSAYMILPHLLMQFAMMVATLLIAIFVVIWMFGGINLHVSTLFFAQATNGTQVIERASQKTPIEANFTITHMKIVLAIFLTFLLLSLFIQIWLFYIVLRTFRYFQSLGFEKSTVLPQHSNDLYTKSEV